MTFILTSVPSEATVTIVISVGIVALLIAALFVVFCAAHQFRRKDSTMYVITCAMLPCCYTCLFCWVSLSKLHTVENR